LLQAIKAHEPVAMNPRHKMPSGSGLRFRAMHLNEVNGALANQ